MSPCLNLTLYSGRRFLPRWHDDIKRLSMLCEKLVGLHYSIEIVQIEHEQRRAFLDGVFASPTIFIQEPGEARERLGGFPETEKHLQQRWNNAHPEAAVNPRPMLQTVGFIQSACSLSACRA
jgi:hypothetical protein